MTPPSPPPAETLAHCGLSNCDRAYLHSRAAHMDMIGAAAYRKAADTLEAQTQRIESLEQALRAILSYEVCDWGTVEDLARAALKGASQ